MTETQQFIEDAIEGGWKSKKENYLKAPVDHSSVRVPVSGVLLDPLAWQAVGKTRGWRDRDEGTFEAEMTCWEAYWYGFYDHIKDGKSIEDALLAIK